jgi:NAD(P)-dependent dehydrogenase (short-subunit alcohol dehydrogenase family)
LWLPITSGRSDVTPDEYRSSLFGLDDLCAVVTGGSSGIGRAIATALAGAGARVVVVARHEETLNPVVTEVIEAGGRAASVAADLGSRDGVQSAARQAIEPFGEPDILVNSAGVNLRPPLNDLDERTWNATMALNLTAPFLLGQRFGPGMAQRGYGRIIHISSQQAHRAFVHSGAYGVSKAGLEALARSQAEAWSPYGVTSNTLVPGFVMTPLNARLSADPEVTAALAARTMIGRNGVAEDFAGAAVFLASRSSAYITGQSLFVDGGLSVH